MLNQLWRIIFCPFEIKMLIRGPAEQSFRILRLLIEEKGFLKILDTETKIIFKCKSRDIINGFYITTIYCAFLKVSNESSQLIITYKGFKRITLMFFSFFLVQLLFGVALEENPTDRILLFLSILIILAVGSRVVFLAVLPQKIKLRDFFKNKLFISST